jgi:hypothetical protein
MGISNEQALGCRILWYTLSSISLGCSLLTPYIIYRMKRWNGTLALVLNLSCAEALYSLGLILRSLSTTSVGCQMQGTLLYFGALCSALWTASFSTTLLLLVTGNLTRGVFYVFPYYALVSIGIFFIFE